MARPRDGGIGKVKGIREPVEPFRNLAERRVRSGRSRADLLRTNEITRRQLRDDAEVRQQIAEHDWRANDAIRKGDYETADAELQIIRPIGAPPDVHMLVGAVEKKVGRRR